MEKADYEDFTRPYKRALKQLILELENYFEDIHINVYSITHRIKSINNAIEKSNKLEKSLNELQDIAGIRIVVSSEIEKQIVTCFFNRKVKIDKMKIISQKQINKKEGYRALHLIFEMAGHYSRSSYKTLIEIQIMTMFEYSFNIISRTWIYKSTKALSNEWHNNFRLLSKKLIDIDKNVNDLYSEMIQNKKNINSFELLTPLSYKLIINEIFNEEISLDDAVDYTVFMTGFGYRTNQSIIDFYMNEEVENFWKECKYNNKTLLGISFGILSKRSFFDMIGLRLKIVKELIKTEKTKTFIELIDMID